MVYSSLDAFNPFKNGSYWPHYGKFIVFGKFEWVKGIWWTLNHYIPILLFDEERFAKKIKFLSLFWNFKFFLTNFPFSDPCTGVPNEKNLKWKISLDSKYIWIQF